MGLKIASILNDSVSAVWRRPGRVRLCTWDNEKYSGRRGVVKIIDLSRLYVEK